MVNLEKVLTKRRINYMLKSAEVSTYHSELDKTGNLLEELKKYIADYVTALKNGDGYDIHAAYGLIKVNYLNNINTMSIFVVDGLYDKSIKKTMYEENLYFRAERIKTRNAHAHLVYKTFYFLSASIHANSNTISPWKYERSVEIISPNCYYIKLNPHCGSIDLNIRSSRIENTVRKIEKDDVFAIVALLDTVLRTSKYLGINNIDISYLKAFDKSKDGLLEIIEKVLPTLAKFHEIKYGEAY
ncbi:MAG: hypothetical protein QXJ93_01835 [Candidatus Rehaiarchaeum fermentans]|nr:hypothetical protein [Candidatus Rehaiarchaeum fermentans]